MVALGGWRLAWDGEEFVRQIRSGELHAGGVRLYRFEGFTLLRGMMYLITTGLFVLTVLTIIAASRLGSAQ